MRAKFAATLGLLLVPLSCEASLTGDGVSGQGSRSEGSGSDGPGWSETADGGACAPSINRDLLLLGELAFVNSLRDLLAPEALEGRLAPDASTKIFSQKGNVANTSVVNSRLEWAIHATRWLDGRSMEVTGCSEGDDVCARAFLESFTHRAFRRPVSGEELDDLMTVYEQGKAESFEQGLEQAMQAVLVSPSFNHRTEYGEPTEKGLYLLTPHEVASLLSYLLTDSLPDEELLAAADSGALADLDERERQVSRMLEHSQVRDSVEKTLMAAWTLGNLFGKVKDPGLYPEFSSALASQMYRETELFLARHLWEGGLASVLDSRTSYVNESLAELYGISFPGNDPTEFVEVELPPERAGLLTQASVLTTLARTDTTSVVARGLFVNGPLLCLPKIPSPPEDVLAAVEEQLEEDLTERERATYRAETSPCNNCHSQFDSYGLLFEQYDAIGRYRTHLDGELIDASVDFETTASFDGAYDNAVSFAEALADRDEFVHCVARHLIVYGTGENGIGSADCDVQSVTTDLSPQSTLADVIRAVVRSPALSVRKAKETP